MITVPSSCTLPLHPLSFFSFNSSNFIHTRKKILLLYNNYITPRRSPDAFLSQHSRDFYSNSFTDPIVLPLISAIKSCSSLSFCRVIHAKVIKSMNYSDGFMGDRLVSVYTKFGSSDDAQSLFNEMPIKDLVSWNSLISGFSRRGYVGKSLIAFCRMRSVMGMQPNEVTFISIISACTDKGALAEGNNIYGLAVKMGLLMEIKVVNALFNMYGKFGYLNLAWRLFEAMHTSNLVSWNSMIAINIQNGFSDEGIGHFKLMRRAGVKPDEAIMVTLVQGCADFGMKEGFRVCGVEDVKRVF